MLCQHFAGNTINLNKGMHVDKSNYHSWDIEIRQLTWSEYSGILCVLGNTPLPLATTMYVMSSGALTLQYQYPLHSEKGLHTSCYPSDGQARKHDIPHSSIKFHTDVNDSDIHVLYLIV